MSQTYFDINLSLVYDITFATEVDKGWEIFANGMQFT